MNQLIREEVIAAAPVEALAGLLDVDVPSDGHVPGLWHWVHLLDRRATRDLGPDGHPISGISAPPGPGLRRVFAGGRVETLRPLRIGEPAIRTTWVVRETNKQGRSGPLQFVTVRHEISQDRQVAISEEQDIAYRAPGAPLAAAEGEQLPVREVALALDIDERLLFRFSALTYNAHRIHYDRGWCQHEGYDDLVVQGPLQALMMGELFRRNDVSLLGRRFAYRLVSPMVGPQVLHVLADEEGLANGAEVFTATGRRTAISVLERQ